MAPGWGSSHGGPPSLELLPPVALGADGVCPVDDAGDRVAVVVDPVVSAALAAELLGAHGVEPVVVRAVTLQT